ncbi:MAG: helicase-related protein, partial [Halobacteria archaeon]|nr:helicase-related protein [Halobacteria archaeon]
QKYEKFNDAYSDLVDVTIRVGSNRIYDTAERFDPDADIIVGTYEGIDHALRTGRNLGDIGTVVIDEVHNLEDEDRGHRVDGLITRLKHYTDSAQWIYLSATVGNPEDLAKALKATLVEYEERPVPIERHLTFVSGTKKPDVIDRLVKREYNRKSSKGYRGQTIVFTNSRRRCHELAGSIEYNAAPYHAGLSYNERKRVERAFGSGEIAAVVTTAALGAGVDFPASQVVFESLAMGIEWLTVQEFEQMVGRAGRPDYHDRGVVYLLAEPDRTYHNSMKRTEDEVAIDLLRGEMEGVRIDYDEDDMLEETLANVAAGEDDYRSLNDNMLGDINTDWAVKKLREAELMRGNEITRLGMIAASHFLVPKQMEIMIKGVRKNESPYRIVSDLDLLDENQ